MGGIEGVHEYVGPLGPNVVRAPRDDESDVTPPCGHTCHYCPDAPLPDVEARYAHRDTYAVTMCPKCEVNPVIAGLRNGRIERPGPCTTCVVEHVIAGTLQKSNPTHNYSVPRKEGG